MIYSSSQIFEKSKKIILNHNLIFIEDVCAMIGISKTTFYEKIKVDSDEMNELRILLDSNKITLKVNMRKKWSDSDNPTLQMALYKLCSTEEEHKKLQQNYTESTNINYNTSPLTQEEINKAKESFKDEL